MSVFVGKWLILSESVGFWRKVADFGGRWRIVNRYKLLIINMLCNFPTLFFRKNKKIKNSVSQGRKVRKEKANLVGVKAKDWNVDDAVCLRFNKILSVFIILIRVICVPLYYKTQY